MPTHIAFLRAINLGAKRKFPKDAIVSAAEEAGFSDVLTYINTGNVRVTSRLRSRRSVEEALEAAFLADRGFDVPTIAFTTAELQAVVADAAEVAEQVSPGYDGAQYVSLLKAEPTAEVAALLEGKPTGNQRAVVRGRAVHLLYPDGLSSAAFQNAHVEKLLGVATNRNLTVVRAVAAKWC